MRTNNMWVRDLNEYREEKSEKEWKKYLKEMYDDDYKKQLEEEEKYMDWVTTTKEGQDHYWKSIEEEFGN